MAQDTAHPASAPRRNVRAAAWEDWTSWPLLVLSLVFVALSTLVLADGGLSRTTSQWLTASMIAMWVIFGLDFGVRMLLADARRHYLLSHWFEVLSLVIPFLRSFLLVLYLWRLPALRTSRNAQRARFVLVAASFGLVFVYVASTLVWLLEHDAPGANIRSFGDAIWWGFSTIATVGYGDYTPVTVPGRTVAVGLMLGGVVIVGILTATVISSLTEQVQRGARSSEPGLDVSRGADDPPRESPNVRP